MLPYIKKRSQVTHSEFTVIQILCNFAEKRYYYWKRKKTLNSNKKKILWLRFFKGRNCYSLTEPSSNDSIIPHTVCSKRFIKAS